MSSDVPTKSVLFTKQPVSAKFFQYLLRPILNIRQYKDTAK